MSRRPETNRGHEARRRHPKNGCFSLTAADGLPVTSAFGSHGRRARWTCAGGVPGHQLRVASQKSAVPPSFHATLTRRLALMKSHLVLVTLGGIANSDDYGKEGEE